MLAEAVALALAEALLDADVGGVVGGLLDEEADALALLDDWTGRQNVG